MSEWRPRRQRERIAQECLKRVGTFIGIVLFVQMLRLSVMLLSVPCVLVILVARVCTWSDLFVQLTCQRTNVGS